MARLKLSAFCSPRRALWGLLLGTLLICSVVYAYSFYDDLVVTSSLKLNYSTATTVPYLDSGKNLISSSVTPTELGYLSGVSSALQTQLNAKEVPLTFSTGLTRTVNTVTVNTSQNIAKLSNLTSDGFVKTSGGDGTLGIDTSTYLTANQNITLSGDVSGSGATAITTTLATVNSNVGSFGSSTSVPSFTVNGKGLITAASGNAVVAPAGTLTGTTLASNVVTSSLTTVGTIGTGVWQGTKVGLAYGGTNADLSATGGTSQVLKQVSSGAAVTVGQLAASDLSNGTTGTGAVVLADSPVHTTQITTPKILGGTGTTQTLTYQTTSGVGATGADHIFLVGNNGATEAMRILNNGAVAIGTASPATGRLLDVNGQTGFRGLSVWTSGASTSGVVGSGDLIATGGAANQLGIASLNDLLFLANGTGSLPKMVLKTSGRLGIGNTAPAALLDLGSSGTTMGVIRFEGSTSGYAEITPTAAAGSVVITLPATAGTVALTANKLSAFASTTSAELAGVISDETGTGVLTFATSPTFTTQITSPIVYGGTGTTSTLKLGATSGVGTTGADVIFQVGTAGAPTELMRLLQDGTLGVGTSAPTGKIHAAGGNAQTEIKVTTNSGTTVSDGIAMGMSAAADSSWIWVYENAPLRIATNNAEAMRVTAAGLVGIGATAPTYPLTVQVDQTGATEETDDIFSLGGNTTTGARLVGTTVRSATAGSRVLKVNVRQGTTSATNRDLIIQDEGGKTAIGSGGTLWTNIVTCAISSFTIGTAAATKTCTGAVAGSAVFCSPSASQGSGVTWVTRVSATDTVAFVGSAAGAAATWNCVVLNP